MGEKPAETLQERLVMTLALQNDCEISIERIERVTPSAQIVVAVLNGLMDNRILVSVRRQRDFVAFYKVLVNPEAFVKPAHGRFKAPGDLVALAGVQALVVESPDGQHYEKIAALRQKRVRIDRGVNVEKGVQRA
jgi:hypothetical protein